MSILKRPGGMTKGQKARVKSASKGFGGTTKAHKSVVSNASRGFGTTTKKQRSVVNKFKNSAQKGKSKPRKKLALSGKTPKPNKRAPKGMSKSKKRKR